MNISPKNKFVKIFMGVVQHYNHEKFWRRRKIGVDEKNNTLKLIKLYYLYYIKKCDAFSNASMGTDLNKGALFESPPNLPHHLNGIIVSHYAKIGRNCTIYQQVTIGSEQGEAAQIGDNVMIGAGSKIIGKIKIGNNVKIGANCVVVENVPDNATIVLSKPRIISTQIKR